MKDIKKYAFVYFQCSNMCILEDKITIELYYIRWVLLYVRGTYVKLVESSRNRLIMIMKMFF